MKNSPFFSVVIPTYNSEKYIERCIDSVENQEYKNYEIIIIDNSSEDSTLNLINKRRLEKLRILTVKNDGIIAYSRNQGIENAKGKWIAFIDSDDSWMPKKLLKVKEKIDEDNTAILIYHDESHIHKGKFISRLKHGYDVDDLYQKLLFKGNALSTSAICIKRNVALDSGGFSEDKNLITVEDYEYWMRLSKLGKFLSIGEILGEWHTHDDNYSGKIEIHVNALLYAKNIHFNLYLKENPNDNNKVKKAKSKLYSDISRIYQKNLNFKKSIIFAKKSLSLNLLNWKAWIIIFLSKMKISYNNEH